MTPYYEHDGIKLFHGSCLDVLPALEPVDCVLTDPPYGLEFMGNEWDKLGATNERFTESSVDGKTDYHGKGNAPFGGGGQRIRYGSSARSMQAWHQAWAETLLAACKPGAMMLAFGGTRTYHRLTCAIEDAGWEIRDCLMWLYAQGFPKSHNFGCKCGGNSVPYGHEKTQHNVRSVQQGNVPQAKHSKDQCGQVLFDGMQEQGSQVNGEARPEPTSSRGEQSSVEGRSLRRAREGLPDDTPAKSSEGATERLCSGTHSDCGGDAGASVETGGRDTPQGLEQAEQLTRESSGLRKPSRALGDGASGNNSVCQTCGGLIAFAGYGTALKPSYEPLVLSMKPLDGTYAHNAQTHGVAGLNIDGGRIGTDKIVTSPRSDDLHKKSNSLGSSWSGEVNTAERTGRWPANVIHDGSDEVVRDFPESTDGVAGKRSDGVGLFKTPGHDKWGGYGGSGSAARFFYCAKASGTDRGHKPQRDYPLWGESDPGFTNEHPTVKPTSLMCYLLTLLATPTGGIVLDPFAGSGSTLLAAQSMGRQAIGIELEERYCEIAAERLRQGVLFS